jgi:predicted peptidase
MKKLFLTPILIACFLLASSGQAIQKKMKTTVETNINYLMFLPKEYTPSGKPQPMIVFLHGSGECGRDLDKVKAWGPPAIVEKNPDFPFIVLSPQCPKGQYWNPYLIKGMIDDVLEHFNVDKSRVYLTGLSIGGFGTWTTACMFPDYFAAIAPVCGGGDPIFAESLRNVPVWAFHGAKDESVPEEESARMVDALRKAGGKAEYTVLPEGGHMDAWIYAYGEAGLFDWFLKQQKK